MSHNSDATFKVKRSNVNLHGAGAYCGGLPHSLFSVGRTEVGDVSMHIMQSTILFYHFCLSCCGVSTVNEWTCCQAY